MKVTLQAGDDPATALNGHTLVLAAKADTVSGTRSAGNGPSGSQVTGVSIVDDAKYKAAFPVAGPFSSSPKPIRPSSICMQRR